MYGSEPPYPGQQSPYHGSIMTPDPVQAFSGGGGEPDNFDDEPPLMEGTYYWFNTYQLDYFILVPVYFLLPLLCAIYATLSTAGLL